MQIIRRAHLGVAVLVASTALASSQAQAPAEPVRASPVLLELFTSEGCSSCPPADALLRELNGSNSLSGQLLIGLSEHVTYWNRLGWSDPFSSDLFTARQSAYSHRFHLDDVYTPQLVVNGSAQVVGSNRQQVEKAIASQHLSSSGISLHILSAKQDAGQLVIEYAVSSPLRDLRGDLFAIIADDLDQSRVLRGENSGRTLSHVSVARSLIRIGPLQTTSEGARITLPSAQAQIASGSHQHVVLFAQAPGLGPVLGVDARPVPHP